MKKDELMEIHDSINDLWKFVKTFWPVKGDNEYWDALMEEADRLQKAHGREYMDELLLLTVYYIEQVSVKAAGEGTILKPGRQLDNLYSRLRKRYE